MKKGRSILILSLLFLAVLGTLTGWEIYRSYYCLKTIEYTVCSSEIKEPVTICLLADLHDHCFGDKNCELVSRVREMQPDLILMAGDFINDGSKDASVAVELISQLKETAPVYFSMGNQEESYMKAGTSDLISEIEAAGAVYLDESYRILDMKGSRICLGGMYAYAFAFDGGGNMDKTAMDPDRLQFLEAFQTQDAFKIMMAHRPDTFIFGQAADTWDIDLVVSGHLHGGQVVLPVLGGLYAGDQGFFPEYVYGEYHFSAVKTMIITSGLGSDREKLPRFHNPPEAVKINLVHGE